MNIDMNMNIITIISKYQKSIPRQWRLF